MILCVGPTPAAQRVLVFPRVQVDAVNRAVRTLESVAGKSVNVAKVLKALGEAPLALGFAGGDRGAWLLGELDARGIPHDFVKVSVPTRECVTVIDESAGTQTELVEESRPVLPADYEHLAEKVNHHRARARAIVLSGTLTPGGPEDFYERCTRSGHEAGLLTVVDAKGAPMQAALAERPGLVKPNHAELELTVGRALRGEGAVFGAMAELGDRGAERVVVTRGGHPSLAWDRRSAWRIRPPRIQVVNPIGSGDSFTAAVVWRLLRGDGLGEACRWGAAAGAANALQWMAGEVEMAQMERLIAEVEVESVRSPFQNGSPG
jgi:1-phosphofructokinase family hexose kinase